MWQRYHNRYTYHYCCDWILSLYYCALLEIDYWNDWTVFWVVLREFILRNVSLLWDLHCDDCHIHTNNFPNIWWRPRFHQECGPYLCVLHHDFPGRPVQLAGWHRVFRARTLLHAAVDPQEAHSQSEAVQSDRYGSQAQRLQTGLPHAYDTHNALQRDELHDGRHITQDARF